MASGDPIYSVTGGAGDGYLLSSNDTYATARSGSSLSVDVNGATALTGQRKGTSPAGFSCYEFFVAWDTSVIPDNARITGATIGLNAHADSDADAVDDINCYLRDWGVGLAPEDWVPGADLGGLTLLAHLHHAARSAGTYYDFTSESALLTSISTTGTLRVVFACANLVAGTEPSTTYQRATWHQAESANEAPRLVVTYEVPDVSVTESVTVTEAVTISFGATLKPAANGDDWFITSTTTFTDSTYCAFGKTGSNPDLTGIRFPNVTIPAGSTITGAYLEVMSAGNIGAANTDRLVHFAAVDNAGAAPTDHDGHHTYFAAVTSDVAWRPEAWTQGSTYQSPSLITPLQAVISRAGWASGNTLALELTGSTTVSDVSNAFYSYNHASNPEPKLIVTYVAPLSISVADTVTVSEAVTVSPSVTISVSDTLSVFEAVRVGDRGMLTVRSTAGDGYIGHESTSWSHARDGTDPANINYTTQDYGCRTWLNGSIYQCIRAFLAFDTSTLPDGCTTTSASLIFYSAGSWAAGAGMDVFEGTQASTTELVAADYQAFGSTALATRVTTWNIPAWNTVALNAAGLALVSSTGYTQYCLRESRDTDNTTPDSTAYRFQPVFSQTAGFGPKLTLNYMAPLSISVADSVTVTEAATAAVEGEGAADLTVSVADTVTLSESLTSGAIPNITLTQGVTVAEALALSLTSFISAVDTANIADVLTIHGPPNASVADAATLSESAVVAVQQATPLSISVSDSVTVSEAVALTIRPPWFLVDALTAQVGAVVSGAYTDTWAQDGTLLTLSEVQNAVPAFTYDFIFNNIDPDDEVGESKRVHLYGYYKGNPAHNVKVQQYNYTTLGWTNLTAATDDIPSATSSSAYSWPVFTTSDYISSALGQMQIRITHTDGNGVSTHQLIIDNLHISEEIEISTISDVTVSDVASIGGIPNIPVSDSVSVGDAATVRFDASISVTDGVTVGEAAQVGNVAPISVAESVTVSDEASLLLPEAGLLYISASETVSVSEAVTVALGERPALNLSVADTVTVSEAATLSITAVVPLSISVSDTASISEAVSLNFGVVPDLSASGSDTATVTDAATVAVAEPQTPQIAVSESVTVTDVATLLLPELYLHITQGVTVTEYVRLYIPIYGADMGKMTGSMTGRKRLGSGMIIRTRMSGDMDAL